MSELIEKLRKLINDEILFDKALALSKISKVRPSQVGSKNTQIYTIPNVQLQVGLDLINKAFKKPAANEMFIIEKSEFPIVEKLNILLKQDPDNSLLVSLIFLQTEKEKKIKFVPTELSV